MENNKWPFLRAVMIVFVSCAALLVGFAAFLGLLRSMQVLIKPSEIAHSWSEAAAAYGSITLVLVTVLIVWYARLALDEGNRTARHYIEELKTLSERLKGEITALRDATRDHVIAMKGLSTTVHQNAQVLALAHYQSRYAHLAGKRTPKPNAREIEMQVDAKDFFEAFWMLHFEEWLSFRDGSLNPDAFRIWLVERREEFLLTAPEDRRVVVEDQSAFNYRVGWESWRTDHQTVLSDHEPFVDIIQHLLVADLSRSYWNQHVLPYACGQATRSRSASGEGNGSDAD